MNLTELFGTQGLVKKSEQVKFYTTEELSNQIGDIFKAQGLTLSEGMTRLVRFLVEIPDELKPIILRQAPGDSALVLAESVVNARSPMKISRSPRRIAAKHAGKREEE